jgi:hypothetical protein
MAATNRTISNLLSRIMYNHRVMMDNPCETCGKTHATFKAALMCGAAKDDRFNDPPNALVLNAVSDALAERDKLRASEETPAPPAPAKQPKKAVAKKAAKKAVKKAATKTAKKTVAAK